MYRNNTTDFKLKSFGIFGEVYFDITDSLTLTGGIRYNDDTKSVSARTTFANFLNPFGNGDPFTSPFVGSFDADAGMDGNQLLQQRDVSFDAITGRAVLDYAISPDNSLYFSYSRGYKSGGINPPLSPVFAVSESFGSEKIDAFEIGSKNTFLDGRRRSISRASIISTRTCSSAVSSLGRPSTIRSMPTSGGSSSKAFCARVTIG